MRVIHHVQHPFAAGEPLQIYRRRAVSRIHAQRRGVGDYLRIGMAGQIAVIILSLPGNDGDAFRPQVLKHRADRHRGPAAAEDKGFFPADPNPAPGHKLFKAVSVGIVPVYAAVGAAHEGIDAADRRRFLRKRRAEGDNGLFIGNGHVQPVPVPFFQEILKLLRAFLIELIFIVRKLAVNGGRIAVAQLFPQKAASAHHITSL